MNAPEPHRMAARGYSDMELIARVMELWDKKLDTVEIALRLFGTAAKEAPVCRALQIGREQRRQQ